MKDPNATPRPAAPSPATPPACVAPKRDRSPPAPVPPLPTSNCRNSRRNSTDAARPAIARTAHGSPPGEGPAASELFCNNKRRGMSGGGGRTRTYEGVASGFTVRPLCRSGHSPFGAWPEAKTPRTSRGAIGPPYLSPAPPCQQLKAAHMGAARAGRPRRSAAGRQCGVPPRRFAQRRRTDRRAHRHHPRRDPPRAARTARATRRRPRSGAFLTRSRCGSPAA